MTVVNGRTIDPTQWLMMGVFLVGIAGFAATLPVFRSMISTENRNLGRLCAIAQDSRVVGISLADAGQRGEQVESGLHTLKRVQHSLESRAGGGSN